MFLPHMQVGDVQWLIGQILFLQLDRMMILRAAKWNARCYRLKLLCDATTVSTCTADRTEAGL